jgi:predicted alpha/beta hydrolase family esterase
MQQLQKTLIIPGIGNSGPEHWQSIWEQNDHTCQRIVQDDWDRPSLAAWIERLESMVSASTEPMIIVAHSLGCLLVAHWASVSQNTNKIHGALLVAVPDPASPQFPVAARSFINVPAAIIPFRTIIVASSTDPYANESFATACAQAWGSALHRIGDAGHINAASGLGEWPYGYSLLEGLRSTSRASSR